MAVTAFRRAPRDAARTGRACACSWPATIVLIYGELSSCPCAVRRRTRSTWCFRSRRCSRVSCWQVRAQAAAGQLGARWERVAGVVIVVEHRGARRSRDRSMAARCRSTSIGRLVAAAIDAAQRSVSGRPARHGDGTRGPSAPADRSASPTWTPTWPRSPRTTLQVVRLDLDAGGRRRVAIFGDGRQSQPRGGLARHPVRRPPTSAPHGQLARRARGRDQAHPAARRTLADLDVTDDFVPDGATGASSRRHC